MDRGREGERWREPEEKRWGQKGRKEREEEREK